MPTRSETIVLFLLFVLNDLVSLKLGPKMKVCIKTAMSSLHQYIFINLVSFVESMAIVKFFGSKSCAFFKVDFLISKTLQQPHRKFSEY